MNLNDYRQSYYDFSGLSSSVTRQAAFAGIALVWIFKNTSDDVISLPEPLLLPTLFLILCLAFDLLHYIVAAAIWGLFHRFKEKNGAAPTDLIRAPIYLNWPPLVLFWSKHAFVVLGYIGLISFLYRTIAFGST